MISKNVFALILIIYATSVESLKYDIHFEEHFYNYDLTYLTLVKTDPRSATFNGVRFDAIGKEFSLKFEVFDRNVLSKNVSLEIHSRDKGIETLDIFKEMPEVVPVEGVVEGDPTSKVFGHIIDEVFAGIVLFNADVLIVEPLSRFANVNPEDRNQVVIYRSTDIKIPGLSEREAKGRKLGFGPNEYFGVKYAGCEKVRSGYTICYHEELQHKANKSTLFSPDADVRNNAAMDHPSSSDAETNGSLSENKACLLEILIDKSYFSNQGRNNKWAVAEAVFLIKIADSVFRAEDFDGDDYDDNLRMVLDRVVIFADDVLSSQSNSRTGEEELELLRSHNQRSCLSIMISNELLKNPNQVTAFIAPDSTLNGGICSHGPKDSNIRPTNVAILTTAAPPPRRRRPLFVTAVVLADMIGLAMGSDRKPCPSSTYDPSTLFGLQGRLPRKLRYHERRLFNSCSTQNMMLVIEKREQCLFEGWSNIVPFCGNGIVDPGEDCDCGSKEFCEYINSCCNPPGKDDHCRYPKGMSCDWLFDACCSLDCQIMSAGTFFCQVGDPECYDGGYCDGQSKKCPSATRKTNGTSCGDLRECNARGRCVRTVCESAGYVECNCPETTENHDCQICCRPTNDTQSCLPARENVVLGENNFAYYMPKGTYCRSKQNQESGTCDGNGKCI